MARSQNYWNVAINQEILQLINYVDNFLISIKEEEKVESTNKRSRQRRSNLHPAFNTFNLDNQLNDIYNQISLMKEDAEKVKSVPLIDDSIQKTLNALEVRLEMLQKQYDNKNRESLVGKKNLDEFIVDSSRKIDYMMKRLDSIELKLLRYEIIDDIISRQFDSALKLLSDLEGDLKANVNHVVHKVYNNQAGNFYLILQLADASKDGYVSLAIYQALVYEIEINEHSDYRKILQLMKKFRNNVLPNLSFSGDQLEAESLETSLYSSMLDIVSIELINAMKNDNSTTTVSTILDEMYSNYLELYNEMMRQVMNTIISKIDLAKVVKFFETQKYVAQIIFGYSNFFKALQSQKYLSKSVLVNLAFGLKKISGVCGNNPLPDEEGIKEACFEARQLKEELPKSVKNLAMATRICIKQVSLNEYLYAGSDTYIDGYWGRRVFTFQNGTRTSGDIWRVQHEKDAFYIKNDKYNEYLYVPEDAFELDKSYKHIRTLSYKINKRSRWIFVPMGDSMYIKNTYFHEHLYASFLYYYNRDNRYAFCGGSKTAQGYDILWSIEDCS